MEHRVGDVWKRFEANKYHEDPRLTTQEQVNAAYSEDMNQIVKAVGDIMRGESPTTDLNPADLQQKAADLERREKALTQKQHGETVERRRTFEAGLQDEGIKRFNGQVSAILANVEKQGGVISPYLKNILPQAIGAKVVAKITANPALRSQMEQLQKLPINDESRTRRLAAIDRAYQMYLPDVAREEIRAAGVQVKSTADAKRAKVDSQAAATKQTEIKGSRGVASGGTPMPAAQAFDAAQQEWVKANPGKPFDKVAKEMVLPRVLQLMGASAR
jgi:hypothetical protein